MQRGDVQMPLIIDGIVVVTHENKRYRTISIRFLRRKRAARVQGCRIGCCCSSWRCWVLYFFNLARTELPDSCMVEPGTRVTGTEINLNQISML